MNTSDDDWLEKVDIERSSLIEKTLVHMGVALHHALVEAERHDEVAMILDAIGELTWMMSNYGDKTDRIPESLGVDLNETAILKYELIKKEGPGKHANNGEWRFFAMQFHENIAIAAEDVGLELPIVG